MTTELSRHIAAIQSISTELMQRAQAHLDQLTKPPGSLGRLEELAARYIAITGQERPQVRGKAVFVFAADHGVAAEGVSAYPAAVTRQMVLNFTAGGAAINVLARHVGATVVAVDIGVNGDFDDIPGLLRRKVAHGTRNMLVEPALTRQQAEESVHTGFQLARERAAQDTDIFATGDMGIGNTTAATAIAGLYGKQDIAAITGRGTGVDDAALQNKIRVIRAALQKHRPNPIDPLDVLSKVGGLEIGGITGLILGAAASRRPVIIDGLISGAAAILACQLNEKAAGYIFPAHRSVEPAHGICFGILRQTPLLDLGMRLGEGTGAALGISLLEAGIKIYNEMATFQSAGVSTASKNG